MNKLLLAVILLFSNLTFSKVKPLFPFKKDMFHKEEANEYLDTQVDYIRSRFYEILSINIIPGKNSKSKARKKIRELLSDIDERAATQQKLLFQCNFKFDRYCMRNFRYFIDAIRSSILSADIAIKYQKHPYIKNSLKKYKESLVNQYFHFNEIFATLNLKTQKITADHLYSVHKKLRDSVFESFDFFITLTNKNSSAQFVSFFHRFIIPTHHITSSYVNHKEIVKNFESLSRVIYDFSFYMDKFEKISKKTKRSANIMMNHWNGLHKFFTRR